MSLGYSRGPERQVTGKDTLTGFGHSEFNLSLSVSAPDFSMKMYCLLVLILITSF